MSNERAELLKWARTEVSRLRSVDNRNLGERSNSVRPLATAALEFLRLHASGSDFLKSAEELFQYDARIDSWRAPLLMADILSAWVDFVEAGMADILPFEVGARLEATTDLMEQVQQLLDDNKVHAAAPMVLAGAALEEFLRSRIAALGVAVSGKPGISSYASALRTAGDLSAQDVKDITAWAGQRNKAAHGEFADLSRAGAQLMVDGINLFIRQKST